MMRRLERWFENGLFGSRWVLAPFYVGLAAAIVLLLIVFVREFLYAAGSILSLSMEAAILKVLSLLDIALAANLIMVVILAGYENFVSKIDNKGHEDRPDWMGTTSFSGLKLKLFASIVAISGIQLLKAFMTIGQGGPSDGELLWMTAIHLAFVLTALLSGLTDRFGAKHDHR